MFVDLVHIKVSSGKGGDGTVAFRREKFVPMGGPSGGDGGKGGDVIFVGNEGLATLIDLKYNRVLNAEAGVNGRAKKMHGANGNDLVVQVPVGTTIYDEETDKVIGDITEHNQTVTVAKGGRGGRGNVKFTTSRNTAPEIAEKGEPGVTRKIRCELKVLADVGLVGLPSVGKSTIISALSNSKPKIADYHFTTLQPNLGVVRVEQDRSFVMADLPGLIEGASLGQGLGLQFLRHIERTRVILHVIDMSGSEGRDPYEDYQVINKELSSYKYDLLQRPQIIIANKMDLPDAKEHLEMFKEQIDEDVDIIPISAYTRDNLQELMYKTMDLLEQTKHIDLYNDADYDEVVEYTFTPDEEVFHIELEADGVYQVTGKPLRKIFEMTDFTKDQSVKRFSRILRSLGVDAALRDFGVQNGDTVRIFEFEFEFID
ncbi:GTPase ObgE [Candidatus Xianfuyuplasma coldseepsis]|uniref:GTPase Obg n=1 Tax=Candidatus Xianfuyuplasma coldseepsis TaxID=2782163 RepID=A0A7L7KSW4_9MOLU|nr:GTPase ObgE [Xianfuyuplasma coldseepsis]QMS85797.1 GTPase ObgE [Xianfuyuplasma coldseepsis]